MFSEDVISLNVLKRLISQADIIHEVKLQDADDNTSYNFLYRKGVAADFFTLIIQGKVEVTIGQDELTFEEGPFTTFGTNALVSSLSGSNFNIKGALQYTPDFTVRAVTDIMYLKIPRGMYKQAVRATLIEREQETSSVDGIIPAVANGPELNRSNVYHETMC